MATNIYVNNAAGNIKIGGIELQLKSEKSAVNGYASLGSDGKVPLAELPTVTGATALNDLTDVTISSPTTDQILKYNSATSQWINSTLAAAGTGKVVQVVQGSYSTEVSTTSTTYVATGLSTSITTTVTNSRILVIVTMMYRYTRSTNAAGLSLRVTRNGTSVFVPQTAPSSFDLTSVANGGTHDIYSPGAFSFYAGSTTLGTYTYAVEGFSNNAATTVYFQPSGATSLITLIEIAP